MLMNQKKNIFYLDYGQKEKIKAFKKKRFIPVYLNKFSWACLNSH